MVSCKCRWYLGSAEAARFQLSGVMRFGLPLCLWTPFASKVFLNAAKQQAIFTSLDLILPTRAGPHTPHHA